jgi:hypothetical protein
MRQFNHPNMTNFRCHVCNSNKDMPVVLVPKPGTERGNIMEAEQVHTKCYELYCEMHDITVDIEPLDEGIK